MTMGWVWWMTLTTGAGNVGTPTALLFPPGWSTAQTVAAAAELDLAIVGSGQIGAILHVVPIKELNQSDARRIGALVAIRADVGGICAAPAQFLSNT